MTGGCACDYQWTCLTGSIDDLVDLLKPPAGATL